MIVVRKLSGKSWENHNDFFLLSECRNPSRRHRGCDILVDDVKNGPLKWEIILPYNRIINSWLWKNAAIIISACDAFHRRRKFKQKLSRFSNAGVLIYHGKFCPFACCRPRNDGWSRLLNWIENSVNHSVFCYVSQILLTAVYANGWDNGKFTTTKIDHRGELFPSKFCFGRVCGWKRRR